MAEHRCTQLKNLFHVDRKKSALWILLGLSSIPLHLLWNSTVVNTLSSNNYIYNAATEEFLRGAPWNTTTTLTRYPAEGKSILENFRNHSLVFVNVTDCIKAYGLNFNSEYGNLILIYDTGVGNSSLLLQGINYGNYIGEGITQSGGGAWMCGTKSSCDFGELSRENATHWNPWNGFDLAGFTWGLNLTEQLVLY